MNIGILGIGIAITFAIIALSAVTLYLAFRIKETFREDKGLKIQFVKTFFLIGILFLAGGLFYFGAQAITPQKLQNDTNTSKITESEDFAKNGSVFLRVSYPANIKTDDNYTVSFVTYNPSPKIIHNASIKLMGLRLLEAKSNFKILYDRLDLGDMPPGETGGYLLLKAPSRPVVLESALIFQSQDTNTVTESLRINVLETALPTPTPNSSSNGSTVPMIINITWPSTTTSPSASSSNPTTTSSQSASASNSTNLTPTATPISNSTDPTSTPTSTPTPTPTDTPTPTPTDTPTPIPTDTPTKNLKSKPSKAKQ